MSKSAVLNVRLDPDLESTAEQLYSSLGITLSDAVNMFLRQSVLEGGMPFRPHQPRFSPETDSPTSEIFIQLTPEEKSLVERYAKLHSMPVGEAFKRALFEKIESQYGVTVTDETSTKAKDP